MMLMVSNFISAHVNAGQTNEFYNPSFDCENIKAASIEYRICTNEELSTHDSELSAIYHDFYFLSKEIKSDQRAWLKIRNSCKDDNCINDAYLDRTEKLTQARSNQRAFPKYILDAMKATETDMHLSWDPAFFGPTNSSRYKSSVKKSVGFKKELFSFDHVTYKQPLVANVQYNDPRLKKALGPCAKYRFDEYIETYKDVYYKIDLSDKFSRIHSEHYTKNLDFTVWKVHSLDIDGLFIKPAEEMPAYIYLVDPMLCQQDPGDDLIAFLNRGDIKRTWSGRYYSVIVSYKNKDYMLESYWSETLIYFRLRDILRIKEKEIIFEGFWRYLIWFEPTTVTTFKGK